RQLLEAVLLQRLELALRELQALCDVGERETLRLARARQLGADAEDAFRRGLGERLSHIAPSAATGTPAIRGSGGAAGWHSSARRRARPCAAGRAARATATRRSASPACCSATPAGAPRRCCPAGT